MSSDFSSANEVAGIIETAPLRVLCIDHEGGHGGSSRSLYFTLSQMNRDAVELEVWCRRDSEFRNRYTELGIPVRLTRIIPVCRAQERFRATLRSLFNASIDLFRNRKALRRLAKEIDERFDIVHLNYESLILFAWWLRKRSNKVLVMHIRSRPVPTLWSRFQVFLQSRVIDQFVFITENQLERFNSLGGNGSRDTIIFNPAPIVKISEPHPLVPKDDRLNAGSLSNASYKRGVDRIVDVAEALAKRGASRNFRFVIAGDNRFSKFDAKQLASFSQSNLTLRQYAEHRGVGEMFLFLGHVSDPERVISSCDLVLKLSRRNDPWGRDVIESLTLGKPVLTTGTWEGFVHHDKSGWVIGDFDAERCADYLMFAAANRESLKRMGDGGREHILELCNPATRASELEAIWFKTATLRD